MLYGSLLRERLDPKFAVELLLLGSRPSDLTSRALEIVRRVTGPSLRFEPTFSTIASASDLFAEYHAFRDETWGDRVVLYNEFLFWQLVRRGLT